MTFSACIDMKACIRLLQISDASRGRGTHELGVLPEDATLGLLDALWLPLGPASRKLGLVDAQHIHLPRLGIDVDDISVPDQTDRTALLRLGGDVTDDKAVGAS